MKTQTDAKKLIEPGKLYTYADYLTWDENHTRYMPLRLM